MAVIIPSQYYWGKKGTPLAEFAVGNIVKIKVNGTWRNFIIAHQGSPSTLYDISFNNGTILLMEDLYETRQWHNSSVNRYASSTIHSYLNSTFLNLIDAKVRNVIAQVKVPYGAGNSTSTVYSGASGLDAKVFLLSAYELGLTVSNVSYLVADGARMSYFAAGTGTAAVAARVAYLSGVATDWWVRTPYATNATWSIFFSGSTLSAGQHASSVPTATKGIRPALVLPNKTRVNDAGEIVA